MVKKNFYFLFFIAHIVLLVTFFKYISNKFLGNNYYYMNTHYEMYFLILICVVSPICFFIGQNNVKNVVFNGLLIFFIEFFLFFCFLTKNLFVFYIFFEAVLVPLYLSIGVVGFGFRKVKASYYLFIYTLMGSFFMLFSIIYMYQISNSFYYNSIETTNFSFFQQKTICFCFLVAFLVKVPSLPFHLWLPEAHVEAPTIGSILLASLVLKIPGFGLINLVKNWHTYGSTFYQNAVQLISCLSIVFASMSASVQIDMKKIIAYSSVAHMNLVILGIFTSNELGVWAAIYLMIGHAFVSSGLFFCAGAFYIRTHTKNIYYYGGVAQLMPLICFFFFFFSISNMSFPGTSNFIGELALLADLCFSNQNVMFISCVTIFFSAVYSMLLYTKISFGVLNAKYIHLYIDATKNEIFVLSALLFFVLTAGVCSLSFL